MFHGQRIEEGPNCFKSQKIYPLDISNGWLSLRKYIVWRSVTIFIWIICSFTDTHCSPTCVGCIPIFWWFSSFVLGFRAHLLVVCATIGLVNSLSMLGPMNSQTRWVLFWDHMNSRGRKTDQQKSSNHFYTFFTYNFTHFSPIIFLMFTTSQFWGWWPHCKTAPWLGAARKRRWGNGAGTSGRPKCRGQRAAMACCGNLV